MTKIEIHGLKPLLPEVVCFLKKAGCLDIDDIASDKELQEGQLHRYFYSRAEENSLLKLEESFNKLKSFLANLNTQEISKAAVEKELEHFSNWSEEKLTNEAEQLINQLEEKVRELVETKQNLKAELANLKKYAEVLKKVDPLIQQFPRLSGYEIMIVLVEKSFAEQVAAVENGLAQLTNNEIETLTVRINQETIALALYYNQKYSQAVRELLWQNNVNELKVPSSVGKVNHQTVSLIIKQQSLVKQKLAAVEKKLAQISQKKLLSLVALLSAIHDKIAEKKVLSHFGLTEYTFLITGWLPSKRLPEFKKAVNERFGENVVVHEVKLSPHEQEEAPVFYRNSKLFQTFEPLISLFETPKYGGIDPTPLLAIFFPLFFGLILGDMGYALLIMAAALFIRHRWGKENQLIDVVGKILLLAGISSFFFGFVYGEFFFNVPHLLGVVRPVKLFGIEFPFDREKMVKETLIFTIAVGFGHIVLGLVLGIVNAIRVKSKHHLFEKSGMLLSLVSLMALILVLAHQLPASLRTLPVFGLIIALPLLIYGGGLLAVLEIFGLVGNILSYARLMALGLVSVMLAKLANVAGGALFKESIVLGLLAALVIHLLNLIIHLFTPTVHALRLNFVEFFGKFVTPGGRPYKPFKEGGVIYD